MTPDLAMARLRADDKRVSLTAISAHAYGEIAIPGSLTGDPVDVLVGPSWIAGALSASTLDDIEMDADGSALKIGTVRLPCSPGSDFPDREIGDPLPVDGDIADLAEAIDNAKRALSSTHDLSSVVSLQRVAGEIHVVCGSTRAVIRIRVAGTMPVDRVTLPPEAVELVDGATSMDITTDGDLLVVETESAHLRLSLARGIPSIPIDRLEAGDIRVKINAHEFRTTLNKIRFLANGELQPLALSVAENKMRIEITSDRGEGFEEIEAEHPTSCATRVGIDPWLVAMPFAGDAEVTFASDDRTPIRITQDNYEAWVMPLRTS